MQREQVEEHYRKAHEVYKGMFTSENIRQVIRELRKALRYDPNYAPARLLLGKAYTFYASRSTSGGPRVHARAITELKKALKLLPPQAIKEKTEVYFDLGLNLLGRNKLDEAIANLDRAAAQAEGEPKIMALTRLGEAYYRKNMPDHAIQIWLEAQKLASELLDFGVDAPTVWLKRAYKERGREALRKNELDKAITYFTRVIELGPLYITPQDYRDLYQAYMKAGNLEKAQEVLNEAFKLK